MQLRLLDELSLPAFHGPMAAADFYLADGVHMESFRAAVSGTPYVVGAAEGLRSLKPGTASGTLYGGCLSILVSLLGTPWEPHTEGKLLFIEDVGTKPYQIDRMLWQLREAGKFAGVSGIIFGEMLDCSSPGAAPDLLDRAILSALSTIRRTDRDWPAQRPCFAAECYAHFWCPGATHSGGTDRSAVARSGGHKMMGEGMKKVSRHIHLSGICGTAMASLAGLLQLEGHRITGSDKAAYPPMSDLLRSLGIPVAEPYAGANLEPVPDLVVIGNALSRGNPEVERVLDERIPFTSMAAMLREEFLTGRESLVVAGTHGKTTTTSMLAWIYQVASRKKPDLEPSFLIGGVAENFGSSFQLRPTRTFILEGDEYDTAFFDKGPKFLHYFPDALILTHVEFDHADIYADLEAVKTAFKRLVNLIPQRGQIVAFDASDNVSECIQHAPCRVERYGFGNRADWQLKNLHYADGATCWEVWHRGELWSQLEMHMAGEHNALNATAAAVLAFGQGVTKEAVKEALASFKSVKRRLELRAQVAGIDVIEDFAHHPTAIRETLRALRAVYPQSRLWAVLEPRSNTLRRKVLEQDLVASLRLADHVVLAGVYQQQRIPDAERLHPEDVVQKLNGEGTPAELLPDADAIVSGIAPRLAKGDVVAILSNGGFDGIYEKLPARLKELHS